jgi:arsenate reductase
VRPRILFVCLHNAGRSRMAAAYLDHLAGDRYEALSAGTEPAEHPHPEVMAAMAEEGIEVEDTAGTLLTTALAGSAHRVVGMGCAVEEACPALSVPLEDWGIPDPRGRPMAEVRVIRDTIRRLVERLVARLDTEAAVR